jgi:hypothetical protein
MPSNHPPCVFAMPWTLVLHSPWHHSVENQTPQSPPETAAGPAGESGHLNCLSTTDVFVRIRKVKCDQDRPACNRCVSTGRICDGEIGTAIVAVVRERQIAPSRDDTSGTLAATWSRSAVQISQTRVIQASVSASPGLSSNIFSWAGLGSDLSD